MLAANNNFHTQLQQEQLMDPLILNALQQTHNNSPIPHGHLERIQRQLRIENGVLTDSSSFITKIRR